MYRCKVHGEKNAKSGRVMYNTEYQMDKDKDKDKDKGNRMATVQLD